MTADSPGPPYVVTATADGLHQQTRRSAAGAFILARLWDELGYTGVTVRDPVDEVVRPGALRGLIRRRATAPVDR